MGVFASGPCARGGGICKKQLRGARGPISPSMALLSMDSEREHEFEEGHAEFVEDAGGRDIANEVRSARFCAALFPNLFCRALAPKARVVALTAANPSLCMVAALCLWGWSG